MLWKNALKYFLIGLCACMAGPPTGGSEDFAPTIVKVEMIKDKPFWLHVTVRNAAKTQVKFYEYQLPWGNYNSMEFSAVTFDGHYIERGLPVDDPLFVETSMEPSETRSGDVDITRKFSGLEKAAKKSSILLFWAYHAPKAFGGPEWPGGLIWIPQQH